MITFLEGMIEEKQPTQLTINVGGVGYHVAIPLSSYDYLPTIGQTGRIIIYDYIREDNRALYGFANEQERTLFEQLISVSGIGPKIALSALSGLSSREIKAAIAEGDVKRLSSISGIGKKMAERMVVELRDKLSTGESLEAITGTKAEEPVEGHAQDAVRALIALGYKQTEAYKLIMAAHKNLGATASVEELVRKALAR